MLYELRIYDAMPGKLENLNGRFANHTIDFFKNHGIGIVGFWTEVIGTSNRLTYILSFDDMGDREEKWNAFQADKGWQQTRTDTEKDGPLVASVQNSFLRLTNYSPVPRVGTFLQELRIYTAMPGKLPALNDRFANHTMRLFKKQGVENIAYWTADVGISNQLVYMLGFSDLGHREKSMGAFAADPEWQKAKTESELNGPLVRRTFNAILRPTGYSPS
jgi:hypothetical protein